MEMENSRDRGTNGVAHFGNININYSRPNESTQDVEIRSPRVVRVVKTIRVGLPATAKASTLRTDTSAAMSKGSSLRMVAFFIDHPILAMLALWLITLIGLVCIFELPVQWAPF
jgi:hypothetical protein